MHELTLHLQQAGLFKDKLPHRSTMARWIRAALELDGEFTVRFVDEEEGREPTACRGTTGGGVLSFARRQNRQKIGRAHV